MISTWCCDFLRIPAGEAEEYKDPKIVQQTFNDSLKRLAGLEAIGFEGVFFAEHHFVNALNPAPNLMVAALAQRTRRMRIGVLGNVLAFHQPWRLAEELAMLDYLTNGRLEIGFASGVPIEFGFVRIASDDVRPLFDEVQDFVLAAAKSDLVTLKGKYFDLEDVPSMPRPRPEHRRRTWTTFYSASTAQKAAAVGSKICTAYKSVDEARIAINAYYEKADEVGLVVSPDDVGVRRQVMICDTDQEAEDIQGQLLRESKRLTDSIFNYSLSRQKKEKGLEVSPGVRKTGVVDAASPPRPGQGTAAAIDFVSMEDEYIYGSPKTVAERIIDQCRRLRAQNFVAYHAPALCKDQLEQLYGNYWPRVVEIVKSADVK